MNINNLNFDSEELIVDYISFNITDIVLYKYIYILKII